MNHLLRYGHRALTAFLVAVLLLTTACSRTEAPSRWDQVQQETTQPQAEQVTPVVAGEPLPGSAFNRFFPEPTAGYDRVYTQEKAGFAEAKLKQDGQDLAMLSVSDTAANPSAVEKYLDSDRTLAGYPAVEVGSTATSILVGDRLQVKVLSRADDFTASDREAWIEQFDLEGLQGLVSNPETAAQ